VLPHTVLYSLRCK